MGSNQWRCKHCEGKLVFDSADYREDKAVYDCFRCKIRYEFERVSTKQVPR